jgi:hypothetical protein
MSTRPFVQPGDLVRAFDELVGLDREGLTRLFRSLPAPGIDEMNGEFASELPNDARAAWRSFMVRLGEDYWLGKSFSTTAWAGHAGHGLNRYRTADGSVRRRSRFAWNIGPSIVDGGPALVMKYAPFKNWGGGHDLQDEVRVAGPSTYLGLYHTAEPVPGFTPAGPGPRSGLAFFFLTGPVGPFVPAEED